MRFVIIATAILFTVQARACDWSDTACRQAEDAADQAHQDAQAVANELRELRRQQQFDEPLLDDRR